MAHRNMVDGTAYDTSGGRVMVDGTVYGIQKGKTMVDGTVREIAFGPSVVHVSFSGEGHISKQYVTIRGEKYYDQADMFGNEYMLEMEPGEEIEAYANSSKTGYSGTIVRSPHQTLASGKPARYTYVVPPGISELEINFSYDTSLGTSRITFYET